jgi:O-antigen/teichoic acid export membrane protein
MRRRLNVLSSRYGVLLGNVGARIAALISLSFATFLVARNGGPPAVGVYALLRVLPSLIGVVMTCGLPGAIAYFLAGPTRDDRRLPTTVVAIGVAGGVAGAALWVLASPVVGPHLFKNLSTGLVMLAGCLVFTRVAVATAKSCSQGSDDLRGSNRVIFTEEFMFLPVYAALSFAGIGGYEAVVAGLVLADILTASLAWGRVARRGFFRDLARPSRDLARQITSYGLRAQVGGVITLMNLRLDFVLLSVMAGPAVLGIYAVASKFAELVKVFSMALTYVLYPRFAKERLEVASTMARKMLWPAGMVTTVAVVPLWLLAGFIVPAIYGAKFEPAVLPARIILVALALDGVAGVVTGFLYGIGRPGLNSVAMGAGLVATVVLDLLLIPKFGAEGAAITSAIAYLTATFTLLWFFARVSRPATTRKEEAVLATAVARAENQ